MLSKHIRLLIAANAGVIIFVAVAQAQIDPAPRQLLHLGVNQSLKDDGPMGAYAFYYWNMPDVPTTNEVLRLVIAPGYVDSELGFKDLLGENTDLGIGAFGGFYANNYKEVDGGDYIREESFNGNAAGTSISIYRLFNPASRIPLNGVLRGSVNYHMYCDTDDTADNFEKPNDQPFYSLRTGLRWGGKEPVLGPTLAMEISGWYELQYRPSSGHYGFNDDRELESTTHQLWARAKINFTLPRCHHYLGAGLLGGTVLNPDRLSAFRVGGVLPYTSEFPLYLPGYYYGELSARSFGLLYAHYSIPLDDDNQWQIAGMAASAVVDYIDGTGQEGAWNNGVGAGGSFTSRNRRWRIFSMVGYGVEAERSDGRGGYTLAVMFQYNFGETKTASDKAFEQLQNAVGVNEK